MHPNPSDLVSVYVTGSYGNVCYLGRIDMTTKTIKLIFDTTPKDDALSFDEYENIVINSIGTDDSLIFHVFIKNPMPLTEFDSIVKELCDKLKYKLSCKTKQFHDNERVTFGTIDMFSSITYYVEITI